ncbi:class I SAM-dependent methyltransferase [Rhodoferax sp.]|uniref:class I SAM-dependent methyltransferase n=1 Tax=Rhodoferax sp. TaxID=50421 RepID=UPI00374DA561
MSDQIIGLHDWLESPTGRYLLAWERAQLDLAVADIFGFHALQLGLPELDTLAANRMPHRWLASQTLMPGAAFVTDFSALPFPSNSLDLVVLPHSLELASDPHSTLREVERVLVPEGRVVICGLNPTSLWGLRQRRARAPHRVGPQKLFLPEAGEFIGYWRLRDWLRLLSFEVEVGRFGCYRPAFSSEKLSQRFEWMDRAGARWWPILGGTYFLVAVKRVRGMTLLSPAWKATRALLNTPVSVANSSTLTRANAPNDKKVTPA